MTELLRRSSTTVVGKPGGFRKPSGYPVRVLCFLAFLFAACDSDGPTRPVVSVQASIVGKSDRFRTLDEDLADLADQLPGFGGFYYDPSGTLTVNLKDESGLPEARVRLTEFLSKRGPQDAGRLARIAGDVSAMRAVPAKYSFRELLTIYRTVVLPAVYSLAKITITDIDDRGNRILIGVSEARMIEAVRRGLVGLGVPADAIEVVQFGEAAPHGVSSESVTRSSPLSVDQSLLDLLRPAPGGSLIAVQLLTGPVQECTLGFNLIEWSNGIISPDRYFLTNAHCFRPQSAESQTSSATEPGQPTYNQRIGFKIADHWWLTPDSTSWCPTQYPLCRFADAALVKYENPVWADAGYVAFPSSDGSTSFNTKMNITAIETPYVGQPVYMVGTTSGRRFGYVTHVCSNLAYDVYLKLCQIVSSNDSDHGDSGSPLIALTGGNTARALALVWGGQGDSTFSSPMEAALNEMQEWIIHYNLGIGTLDPDRPPPPPPPPINVSLSGPSTVRPSVTCLWTATPQGTAPYSYSWLVNNSPVGNGSQLPQELIHLNNGSAFTIEVRVVRRRGCAG